MSNHPVHFSDRESALLRYFYTVSTDPKIKAAGGNIDKFGRAFFACVAEDLHVVSAFVFKGVVDRSKQAASMFSRMAVGAVMDGIPPALQNVMVEATETAVEAGFREVGRFAEGLFKKAQAKGKKAARR